MSWLAFSECGAAHGAAASGELRENIYLREISNLTFALDQSLRRHAAGATGKQRQTSPDASLLPQFCTRNNQYEKKCVNVWFYLLPCGNPM